MPISECHKESRVSFKRVIFQNNVSKVGDLYFSDIDLLIGLIWRIILDIFPT